MKLQDSWVSIKKYERAEFESKFIREEFVKVRDAFNLNSTIEEKKKCLLEAFSFDK